MLQKIIKKQTVILFLSVLMLGLFIFVTYFCWVPDTLIPFVPDNVLFYAHLNLNKFHYSGHLAQKWLKINKDKTENIFKKYLINPDTLNSLEEISLFVLTEDDLGLSQLGLILKSKISVEDLQELLLPSFLVKQMSDKVFVISSQIDLDRLENLTFPSQRNRFRFISPFNKTPSLAQGYVDLELISTYLPIKKKSSKSKFVRFNILRSSSQNSKLFFETENKNSFDYSLFSNQQNNFPILGDAFDFVFIFPTQEPLNKLKDRIKIYLALQKPKERKVVLPDNSSFIELVAEPQDFIFKKEGQIDYWQNSLGQNFEIAFFQDEKRTFFSNNHILLKKIISVEQKKNSNSVLYWEINNPWLQRLVIQEKGHGISGFLELK